MPRRCAREREIGMSKAGARIAHQIRNSGFAGLRYLRTWRRFKTVIALYISQQQIRIDAPELERAGERCPISYRGNRNIGRAGGRLPRGNPATRPDGGRAAATRRRWPPNCISTARRRPWRARRSSWRSPAIPLALRLCLERTIAPRRERPEPVALPPLRSTADLAPAMGAVAAAVARGLITTGQAAELSAVFATLLRAVEASEFDRQLRAIEHGHSPQ